MIETSRPRGRYFEEFAVGDKITTAGRTVTETDIVGFAGLSGDFNQIHVDDEFAKGSVFKQRVAHGLLGLSIASGLAVQTGFMEGTIMALRELQEWKFSNPIFIGDTIHVEIEVLELKAMPRLGGGLVTIKLTVKNQKGETAQQGKWLALMLSQPK
ncbi:MAG: MaoC family dehydratase N-terminal domain-containing protein [Chloroflexi bacterium]|nr:MaoC family dehydratase N-terminal domain-containing protein [Chloroflexota bacterium]